MVAYTGYDGTGTTQGPTIRKVVVRGELVTIIDCTTATTTDTVTCPGPYCLGSYACNCNPWGASPAPIEKLKELLHRGRALDRDLRSFIKSVSLIPCKGYGGILPPVQDLPPKITTAAPAPDDRRRAIWAFMTVRPTRVP